MASTLLYPMACVHFGTACHRVAVCHTSRSRGICTREPPLSRTVSQRSIDNCQAATDTTSVLVALPAALVNLCLVPFSTVTCQAASTTTCCSPAQQGHAMFCWAAF